MPFSFGDSAGEAVGPDWTPPDPIAVTLAARLADRGRSGADFRARFYAFHTAELAARKRWRDEYETRNRGAAVTMSDAEWGQKVNDEVQRQDEGRPKTQRIDPAIENAGEHVRTIRGALEGFLRDWNILPQPAAPNARGQIETRGSATAPSQLPRSIGTAEGAGAPAPRSSSAAAPLSPAGPPPAAPTNLYGLLKATLRAAELKRAEDVLWNNCVSDTPFPMPSRQEIESAWETYLRTPAPARDVQLRAFLKAWNLR
jgi:hypothetical protein